MKKLLILIFLLSAVFITNINPAVINVTVNDDYFSPTSFTVQLGDTVVWTYQAGHSHTTTSTSVPVGASTWDHAFTGTGDTFSYIVSVEGVYEYWCGVHTTNMMASFSTKVSLPFIEDFNFTSGDSLTHHGWVAHSGTTNPIPVSANGLTYSGYIGSGVGKAASLTTTGQDVNRQFTETSSGAVYASFMVNVTSAQSVGDYFFHFGLANTTSIFLGRVFVKLAANSNLAFGLSKSSTNATVPPVYSDSIYTTGTTYLLVLKYQFNAGTTDDTVSLFINPAITPTEPSANLMHGTLTTGSDPANIGGVYLRQGTASNAPNVLVDGIRIGTTWGGTILPVELKSFSATTQNNGILLSWSTATEINNSGFNIERKQENSSWNKISFVNGNGTSTSEKKYSYFDGNLTAGKYQYRLKQIDFDGTFEYSNIVEVEIGVPSKFELSQNYPNPFNPSTKISYSVPKSGYVSLKVYNALGQEVASLVNGIKEAGIHSIEFNAVNLNSGIYFYKLEAGNISQVKKMMLIK